MSKDLLLEIGTEEMPANIMSGVVDQLKALAREKFDEARVTAESVTVYATPRRLAVIVLGATDRQADEQVKKRGPSVKAAFDSEGNPTKAALGFARGQHIDVEKLTRDGEYTWAEVVNAGKPVEDILPGLFTSLITGLSFARSMRWGSEEAHFIRPVRWLVALAGSSVVPMEFAHVKSGRLSRGHRFLSEGDVEISSAREYKEALRKAFVIVDQDERRELIVQGLKETAESISGEVWHNADLLEEINYLVEYPTPLYGRIDEKFLKLPVPAVVTPMRDHQRYYPVRDKGGKLMPYFLTVRNGGTKAIHNVQVGNERVLRARLADAQFFFDNDRKKSLEAHREDLTRINYQEGMGTLLDKADRLGKLVEAIGSDWSFHEGEKEDALRAAFLSKSDLATGIVTEFTELQGEMGREYALLDGEKTAVADAIFEQYMPRFSGDRLPKSNIGRALSLADKLDNLAATFLRGLIPTGSQDPYALRRQTIGAVNILVDGKVHWDIRKGIRLALSLLPGKKEAKEIAAVQVEDYFRQRIRGILLDRGIDYDIVDAVGSGIIDDVYAIFLKADSMTASRVKNETELRQAVTRLANITKGKTAGDIDEALLQEDAEKKLAQAIRLAEKDILSAYKDHRYGDALPALKSLTAPINAYLDSVMVMVDDDALQQNRIATLMKTLSLFQAWGDFSKLV
ncbi:MAG: glycine--tRNA ligase subunit beta [Dialister sp.]|nr:glycine--tRNA ligase subunit beta [Dialister sp.]